MGLEHSLGCEKFESQSFKKIKFLRSYFIFVTYLPREVDGRVISEICFFFFQLKIERKVLRDSRGEWSDLELGISLEKNLWRITIYSHVVGEIDADCVCEGRQPVAELESCCEAIQLLDPERGKTNYKENFNYKINPIWTYRDGGVKLVFVLMTFWSKMKAI